VVVLVEMIEEQQQVLVVLVEVLMAH
jgi:hypothetical protein